MRYVIQHKAGPYPGRFVKNKNGTGYTTDPNEALVIGPRSKVAWPVAQFTLVPVRIVPISIGAGESDGS